VAPRIEPEHRFVIRAEDHFKRRALKRRLQTRGRHRREIDAAGDQRLIADAAAHEHQIDFEPFFLKITAILSDKEQGHGHVEDGYADANLARLTWRGKTE